MRARKRLLLLVLPLLAGCALQPAARRSAATPVPPPVGVVAARAPGQLLAADPGLQELIDPYPSTSGPSWLGGDVASSIRLADDRWVWIFGDTLLGELSEHCAHDRAYCDRALAGPGSGMIANSAGTMVRSADGALSPIVKYWRSDPSGEPAPIFVAPGDGFLWPLAGVRVGQVLLVAANRHTVESGLAPAGNLLLRVWNPDAPPDAWLYDVWPLPGFRAGGEGVPGLSWTAALVVHGDHVYLFGSRDVGFEARTVLARLDARALADPGWEPALEYLHAGAAGSPAQWSTVLDPDGLHLVEGLPGTSEASIDFAEELGWYTFQIPALHYDVRLYTAANLLGPWRDRGVAYELPEAWRATRGACSAAERAAVQEGATIPGCDPLYAAYAPKAHPELAARGGFVVTYNVNTWGGGPDAAVHALQSLHGFYVPQMVSGEP